jgi:hypothetical protein
MMSNIASPWRYDTEAHSNSETREYTPACDLALPGNFKD